MNGKLFIKLFFFFFMLHAFEAFAQEKDTTEKKKDTIKTSRSLRRLLLKDSESLASISTMRLWTNMCIARR